MVHKASRRMAQDRISPDMCFRERAAKLLDGLLTVVE